MSDHKATIGLIGGSGLYGMKELEQVEEVTIDTPYGQPSDTYVVGTLAGHRVAFLPRHGRGHRIMPSEIPSRANIYGFKQLGVKYLISVSAVGSLREEYHPGHVVIPEQIYDNTKGIRPATFFGNGVVAHPVFDRPYCSTLRDKLHEAATKAGATVHKGGTYVCMEGPQFSTIAESEENRRRGHDLIGMTALPEAKLAREAEIAYATLAMITDYDCWHPEHDSVTIEMIISVLQANVELSQRIVREVVTLIGDGFDSPAHTAMQNAIITDRSMISDEARQRLDLLVGKYL
jgi:5'-methylthioadenosine phosphorylase